MGKSKVELAEPDDADETEAERFLRVREEIGMGSEWGMFPEGLLVLLSDIWRDIKLV